MASWIFAFGLVIVMFASRTEAQGLWCGIYYTCPDYMVNNSWNGVEKRIYGPPATILVAEGNDTMQNLRKAVRQYVYGDNEDGLRLSRSLPLVTEFKLDDTQLTFSKRITLYLDTRVNAPIPHSDFLSEHVEEESTVVFTKNFTSHYDEEEILTQAQDLVSSVEDIISDDENVDSTTIYYAVYQYPFRPGKASYSEVGVKVN